MYSQPNGRPGPGVIDNRTKRAKANSGYGRRNDARAGFQPSYSYNDPSGANSRSNPVTPTLATGPPTVDMFGVNSFNTSVNAALAAEQMAAANFSHMNSYGSSNTIRPHTASSANTCPPKPSHLSRAYDSAVDLSAMAQLSMLTQPSITVLGLSDTSPINSSFSLQQIPLTPQTQSMGSTVPSPLDVYLPQDSTTITPQLQSMNSTVGPLLNVYLQQNKTTVRPEVEMKMKLALTLETPEQFRYIRFPRELLARPSQLATEGEVNNNARSSLYVSLHLVSDSTVRTKQGKERAMRRARGSSPFPPRDPEVPVTELPKNDPAHPQNGGKMIICKQCRVRERKRYGRKKQVDEERWNYESERIILVNENEFKRLTHPTASQYVKSVDFKMRILCYNRHQDCLEPDGRAYSGYRVVFTFKDFEGSVIGQRLSDVYHIADDHKDAKLVHPNMAVLQPQTLPSNGMSGSAYAQPQLSFPSGQAAMNTSPFVQTPGPTYTSYDQTYWGH